MWMHVRAIPVQKEPSVTVMLMATPVYAPVISKMMLVSLHVSIQFAKWRNKIRAKW